MGLPGTSDHNRYRKRHQLRDLRNEARNPCMQTRPKTQNAGVRIPEITNRARNGGRTPYYTDFSMARASGKTPFVFELEPASLRVWDLIYRGEFYRGETTVTAIRRKTVEVHNDRNRTNTMVTRKNFTIPSVNTP